MLRTWAAVASMYRPEQDTSSKAVVCRSAAYSVPPELETKSVGLPLDQMMGSSMLELLCLALTITSYVPSVRVAGKVTFDLYEE